MERKISRIQLYYLFKSFMIMFAIQAVLVLLMPMALTAPVWYQLLAVNLAVSATLGWFLYKQRYHIMFSYNSTEFKLRKGKNLPIVHRWDEFSRATVTKGDYGDFYVRLYQGEDAFDIPVSKLKLDPFSFRNEIAAYISETAAHDKMRQETTAG